MMAIRAAASLLTAAVVEIPQAALIGKDSTRKHSGVSGFWPGTPFL